MAHVAKMAAYRSALAAPDTLAAPGTITCTKQAGGSATAGVYTVFVVAGNTYGRTAAKQGDATVTTETTNLKVRTAFAAVSGATYYDFYCSTDGSASKWVGRITAAQHLAGGEFTAVNTYGTGAAIPGVVDILIPGTGSSAGLAAVNNAYTPEAATILPFTLGESAFLDVDVELTLTGDAVTPEVVIVPFFQDDTDSLWYAGAPQVLSFGWGASAYNSLRQRVRMTNNGIALCKLLLGPLTATGAAVDLAVATGGH